jgi:hypothetical protein
MVRTRPWFLALTLAPTWGCGDGIGQPIVGTGIVSAGAGGLGTAGAMAGMGGAAG